MARTASSSWDWPLRALAMRRERCQISRASRRVVRPAKAGTSRWSPLAQWAWPTTSRPQLVPRSLPPTAAAQPVFRHGLARLSGRVTEACCRP